MEHHRDHPVGSYTTFKIGGIARDFYVPESKTELKSLISDFVAAGTPYRLLGNGSNVLIASKVLSEPVILMTRALSDVRIDSDGTVTCGASVDIRKLVNRCAKHCLRAPTELLTVPATIGGAVYMNAGRGSLGVTIADCLEQVTVYDGTDEFRLTREECRFGHRRSIFHDHPNWLICEATFRFQTVCAEQLQEDRRQSLQAAFDKAYRNTPSAGSVFRDFDQGVMQRLRGFKIGPAAYAENPSNCIVNLGDASPWQVKSLILVSRMVHAVKRKQCNLEIEIW